MLKNSATSSSLRLDGDLAEAYLSAHWFDKLTTSLQRLPTGGYKADTFCSGLDTFYSDFDTFSIDFVTFTLGFDAFCSGFDALSVGLDTFCSDFDTASVGFDGFYSEVESWGVCSKANGMGVFCFR